MPERLRRIVSGGQTGADRGGLDAAIRLGIPHGGWCPKGRRAEDGRIPGGYRLEETESADYPERTERNVVHSDGTVVFTHGEPAGGSALTLRLAEKHRKPSLHLDLDLLGPDEAAARLREWTSKEGVAILNVAGSRESNARGLRKRVLEIVSAAFSAEEDEPRRG